MRLVNLLQPGNAQKIPKAIKKIYHQAGDIRNLQLHQKRISGLTNDLLIESPFSYLKCLRKEEKSKRKKIKRKAKQISFKDFKKKLIDNIPSELTHEVKKEFVQKSKLRLEQLLSLPFYYDETLHDIRKILKDLSYNYQYLNAYVVTIMPADFCKLDSIENVANTLGEFHDLSSAVLFLSPVYRLGISGIEERKILYELKTYLELRKKDMFNDVLTLLKPARRELIKDETLLQAK
jgi:cellulose biosynthesis protein BcsQ